MSTGRRLGAVAAAAVAAIVLFVLLRPEGDSGDPSATTTPQTTPRPAARAPRTQAHRITVRVRDGRVRGGLQRVEVETGRRVTLVVHADVSDHVHVHGYNLLRDVSPTKPAVLSFRANVTGRFEVELEEHRLLIVELEVLP